jgi:hypothetical protein
VIAEFWAESYWRRTRISPISFGVEHHLSMLLGSVSSDWIK